MIVIPDVHGFSVALKEIVDKFHDRSFIFLGDIVDRGPDVKGCYEIIRKLHAEGRATLLMGNHEHMIMDVFYNNNQQYDGISWHHGLIQTLESYNAQEHIEQKAVDFLDDFGWYMQNAHDYAIVGNVLISHAARPLLDNDGNPLNLDHIWNRPQQNKDHPLPEGVEYSVHGHTPLEKPVLDRYLRTVYIDLGMYDRKLEFSGRYSVLDILNRVVWVRTKKGKWESTHYTKDYFK